MRNILVLFLILSASLYSTELDFKEKSIELDPVTDGLIGFTAIALNGYVFLETDDLFELQAEDSLVGHNKDLDEISDYLLRSLVAAPALLLFDGSTRDDTLDIVLVYAETYFLTYGLKRALKTMITKERPNNYDSDEYYDSFPSGHTALSFMSAGFITSIALNYDVDYKGLYIGSSIGLAGVVGALRVTSGSHHVSDVLAGALLGSVIGYSVPLLHMKDGSSIVIVHDGDPGLLYSVML